jgi:sortase A
MYRIGNRFIAAAVVLLAMALGLFTYNTIEDILAEGASAKIMVELNERLTRLPSDKYGADATYDPDRSDEMLTLPEREMPTVVIDGDRYVGRLYIKALDLDLPILAEYDYDKLSVAPCRFSGSVYSDDIVIAAHNYSAHFGKIGSLMTGDKVVFTDCDGVTTTYFVASTETVSPYDVDYVTDGKWALTLFTCTLGGNSRVVIRCEREKSADNY